MCGFRTGPCLVVSRMSLPRGLLAVPAALLASPDLRQAMRPGGELFRLFPFNPSISFSRSLTWMEPEAPFFGVFLCLFLLFYFFETERNRYRWDLQCFKEKEKKGSQTRRKRRLRSRTVQKRRKEKKETKRNGLIWPVNRSVADGPLNKC